MDPGVPGVPSQPLAVCPLPQGVGARAPGYSLAPVRLQQCRIVDNGRKQGREGPQEEGREELADDWVLQHKVHGRKS